MEETKASTVAEDATLFLEHLERHRDEPQVLRALFDAARNFVIAKMGGREAYDRIILSALAHASLYGSCMVISAAASRPVQERLRQALVASGRTMEAVEIAATMRLPLNREEIVCLGNSLARSDDPLSSAKNLLDYAKQQQLPELDMRRLFAQAAEVVRVQRSTEIL